MHASEIFATGSNIVLCSLSSFSKTMSRAALNPQIKHNACLIFLSVNWLRAGGLSCWMSALIKTCSLNNVCDCSTGINSWNNLFLPHTHSHSNSFLCLSLKLQSRLHCSNNSSVLDVTPTVLRHPNPQLVLLQFGASDHRSSRSWRGRVSRVVTAIS